MMRGSRVTLGVATLHQLLTHLAGLAMAKGFPEALKFGTKAKREAAVAADDEVLSIALHRSRLANGCGPGVRAGMRHCGESSPVGLRSK